MTGPASTYDCLLVGATGFPHGDASANRLLSLAKTFRAAGHRPLVVNDGAATAEAAGAGRLASCDGIDYLCLPQREGGRITRALHRGTRPWRIARAVRGIGVSRGQLRWVCAVSGLTTVSLYTVVRSHLRAALLADVLERHDVSQFPTGWRDPYLLRHRYTSWLAARLPTKVLVISDELRDRFSKRKETLVLPPAVDADEYAPHERHGAAASLHLLYAGSPGRKDLLGEILNGIAQLSAEERGRLRLTIAGPGAQQVESYVGADLLRQLDRCVEIVGVVPRAEVHALLAAADFSLLLRPAAGFARAGFPSKVPESLAAGCPMILNYSSDLQRYVEDGREVLVCRDGTAEHVAEAFRRALALSGAELAAMSSAARATAVARFDYRVWGPPLAEFLAD